LGEGGIAVSYFFGAARSSSGNSCSGPHPAAKLWWMAVAAMTETSLRPERAETSRLAWAFALSLGLHLLVFGAFQAGKTFGWWENWRWPAWLQPVKMLTELLKKNEIARPPETQREAPLRFVDVSPEQATTDAPKDTKYYSDKNARAANPEPEADTGAPRITGKQTEIVKTEDIPREKFTPLQPARQAAQPQEEQPELKAKPAYTPGELTLAKPEPIPRKDPGDAPQPRPATIKEALARQQNNTRLPGEKMKQDGGVTRRARISAVDTKLTSYGAYDAALIEAITHHWFSLLDERAYAYQSQGKVVLQFRLHYDGRITDLTVAENTAGEVLGLICQKAVLDPVPYAVWPRDMRSKLGDERNIQFAFYYN
jgi:hypothetical protein